MSSLQQALNNAGNKLKLKKLDEKGNQNRGGGTGGVFENSFARGLDLSEFVSTAAKPYTSASEELLNIKKGERRQRQIQEEEEGKMQEALQKRLNFLKNHANNKGREQKKSVFEIGDALVRMHGSDEMAAAMLSQKANTRKGGIGSTANRRRNSASRRMSNNNNKKTKKSSFAKKSRQTKF